ncbi:MAG: MFS transporter [Blastocatellia bacterium]|nr:MFS transporter [Blastocatellia bacterium]
MSAATMSAAAVTATTTPPTRINSWTMPSPYLGTFGVFLGAAIVTLNGRLLTVTAPELRAGFGLSVDDAAWITTSYNMALMFMGPFSVYLGGLFGTRRTLLYSGAIFALVSLLLPFSPNLGVLLFLQVIAGLSSGTFYPLTLGYAFRSLPIGLAIYVVGAYSMDILGGLTLATPLAAWLTESLSWRWVFWASVALTPLMMLCVYLAIPNPAPNPGPKPAANWRGFLYASLGVSLLYGALDQGQRLDWFHSGVITAMTVTGAFLLVVAAIRRLASPNPFFNLPFLFKRNTMIVGAVLFSFRFVLLAVAVLIPTYLGAIQNYRQLEISPVMWWIILPQLVMGWISVQLMRRLDGRLPLAAGFAIVAAACLMNAHLTSAWSSDNFWWSQLVMAVGLSLAFVGLVGGALQQSLESGALASPFNVLTYSAYLHGIRLFGGEIGAMALQRLIATREQYHSNMLGLGVAAGDWLTDERLRTLTGGALPGSSGMEEAQLRAATLLGAQLRQQAYTLAYIDSFLAIACASGGIIVLIALMKRMKLYFNSPPYTPPN